MISSVSIFTHGLIRRVGFHSAALVALLALGTAWGAIPAGAQAFDPRSLTGLGGDQPIDPAQLQDVRTAEVTRAYIPDAIDLSPLMPPPVLQRYGSCVSYAIGYALRGYYSALENGTQPGQVNFTPSPAFLHSRIRNPVTTCDDAGSNALLAMRYFSGNGAPDRDAVPDSAICTDTAEYATTAPTRFRIRGFEFIFSSGRRRSHAGNRVLDAIKQQLAAGNPVATGFRTVGVVPSAEQPGGATLQYLKAGEIYRGSLGPNSGPSGGHQMVFVGYDERRQAFLVQNSWGPSWAGDGYGWISYAAARADMHNASIMRTNVVPPRPVPGITRTDRDNEVAFSEDACSRLYVVDELSGLGPVLNGFVSSREALRGLSAEYAPEQIRDVAIRPWPVCEVLKTLDGPLAEPSRPEIRMLGGETTLSYGDSLAFQVRAPDFASFLYIVYLQADGTVVNLLPRRGPVRQQVDFGARFVYGDGRKGRQKFTVQPPSGAEAIVVIAARSPISQLEELEEEGGGQFTMPASAKSGGSVADDRHFLTALRAGMAERPDELSLGREISAAVLHLTIRD
ncbi:DUF4384 domain-containing protein [Roseibium marinum]|uniref:C1A family cysteine protease n=1 Tax=Roseibium marinum TaxID=281252 RepID=A0A2S3UQ39_9HYPH|nr:DUF4384 domain-containing protein [Roseibium marinum]POF29796.1 C1A family cysteine protease [Roseibium marinum]